MSRRDRFQIVRAGAERIADLEPLYLALHRHHSAAAPTLAGLPARSGEEAWRRRRSRYEAWLSEPDAFALLAEREGQPVGFAVVSLTVGYQGWASSERIADVHDLAVLPGARGDGVGTALLDAVGREASRHGVREYRLLVLEANASARRFYDRRGLRPVATVMLGRVAGDVGGAGTSGIGQRIDRELDRGDRA